MEASELKKLIRNHVGQFWPNNTISEEVWQEGPIHKTIPRFSILRIEPLRDGNPFVYVTSGCALAQNNFGKYEFVLLSPVQDPLHVETLTMLAHFVADKDHRVNIGDIVKIGRPWLPHSRCDRLLISLPYPYGPKLEYANCDGERIRFLWTLPITAREAAFAELNGTAALEEKFDDVKLNYLDAHRTSAV